MKLMFGTAALAWVALSAAQGYDPANYRDLNWRNVGPDRGGRSIACTGVRKHPNEFYFGATGGGLWKTTDAGKSWRCVTDGALSTSSVGAVAVSDSDPNVLYIGTGEREIRGDISEGDGVYKSTDGGATWKSVGLRDTRNISKIAIDPQNPDIVYVAALGHVYGSGPDRGVYKSTDGGKTWNKILFVSDQAGAVDLQIDPFDAKTVFAATWEAWRTPYHLNSGGPGSRLFKSTDGGLTWSDLSRAPGLPKGVLGKIGIGLAPSNPLRVYAIIEAADGGIFQSDDRGNTWKKVNENSRFRQRAWYFSHVIVDPKDSDHLFCLNVEVGASKDAGKTWTSLDPPHGDNHDLWIDPDDSNRMIEANDGGATVTTDGGKTWTQENYPTAEIYHVVADSHFPYRIYGAQQDNSSVQLSPSEPSYPGHPNFTYSAAGESGYVAVKSDDPDIAYGSGYGGALEELNSRTGIGRDISPWPDNPMGHAAKDIKHRFQWTFPVVGSPNDPKTLYVASQYLLRSRDAGHSWQTISPDLTRNDRSRQNSSGGPITQDNTSVEYYDTIFSVAESPRQKGLLWVGSDDGLVHVSRNGGGDWTDVTPTGMPHWGRVSSIEPSPHDAGTAFVAVNDYQSDDRAPYLYRTHDFGRTWTRIVTGLPADGFARVCREDLKRPGLLYAGTESGAYVSFDDGSHWQSLQLNLPNTPVHDLTLKDDDLIAATHGRSFWILHGTSRLAMIRPEKPAAPLLYRPVDRYRVDRARVEVDYYLPSDAKSVNLTFLDSKGAVVGKSDGQKTAGVHHVDAYLGHAGFRTFPGMVLWSGRSRQVAAPPGTYTVRLDVDGVKQDQKVQLLKDPRVSASTADLEEQYRLSVEIVETLNQANGAVLRIRNLKSQLGAAAKADPSLEADATSLIGKLTAVEGEIYQYRSTSGEDPLNYEIKLNDRLAGVLGTVESAGGRPSVSSREVYAQLGSELKVQLQALSALEAKDLAAFNARLKATGKPAIVPADH